MGVAWGVTLGCTVNQQTKGIISTKSSNSRVDVDSKNLEARINMAKSLGNLDFLCLCIHLYTYGYIMSIISLKDCLMFIVNKNIRSLKPQVDRVIYWVTLVR